VLPCALALLAAAPAQAWGATASGEQTPLRLDAPKAGAPVAGGGVSVVRTLIGLVVVVAIIYGSYWVLKQVKASREARVCGEGLSTLATLPLGPGRSLHVVRAGSEVLLVGVADHGVTPIRAYTEDEAQAAGLVAAPGEDDVAPRGRGVGGLIDDLRRRTIR